MRATACTAATGAVVAETLCVTASFDPNGFCEECGETAPEHEVALLRKVLVFADGLAIHHGYRLADLYAVDSWAQGVLERAGCWTRTGDAP